MINRNRKKLLNAIRILAPNPDEMERIVAMRENIPYNINVVSWTQLIDEKCKQLFGTFNLEDDRVSDYYLLCIKRDNREVYIDDDLFSDIGLCVYDEDECFGSCFKTFKSKEECLKFCEENNLKLKE